MDDRRTSFFRLTDRVNVLCFESLLKSTKPKRVGFNVLVRSGILFFTRKTNCLFDVRTVVVVFVISARSVDFIFDES